MAEQSPQSDYFDRHRVVFLYPEVANATSFTLTGKHLGASYVRAYLKTQGIPTHQFTADPGASLDEIVGRLTDEAPAFLGVTTYDCTYHTVKMLLRELKARRPEVFVLLGGPTATFSDALVIEDLPEVDVCVRGDGEHAAHEILDACRRGEGLGQIAGITYRGPGGAPIRNPDRPLLRGQDRASEMDVLPSPYLEGILTPADGQQVGILTARGCTFRCVYCNFAAMSRWTVRFHSVDRVMAEMAYITGSGGSGSPATLSIQDDAFTLDRGRAKEICRRILDARLPLRVNCETRADTVDDELLELMGRAGFGDLHFGVESGAPAVLHAIKKASSRDGANGDLSRETAFLGKVRRAVRKARSVGLRPTVSIILGLPTETEREGRESVRYIASLDRCRYYHNYLEIFAGTDLFDNHERYGIGLAPVHDSAVNRLYRTRHAYDVSAIPVLRDRTIFEGELQASEFATLLSGDPWGTPADERRPPSLVVFTEGFPDGPQADWFVRTASMGRTRLALLAQDPRSPGDAMVHEMFMPLQMLYWLRCRSDRSDGPGLLEKALAETAENFIPYKFAFHDIRAYGQHRVGAPSADGETQHVFQLAGGGDWAHQVSVLDRTQHLIHAGRVQRERCLDVCRWSSAPCPAPQLGRAVVDGSGHVFPCFSGCASGSTREGIETVRSRLRRVAALAEATRGCRRCPVRDACSRCLFPHPMSVESYCAIQRARLGSAPDVRCA